MIDNPFTIYYFPTALALGALHALEPGHAKTLTAAYLIGIKGTKRDALLLGISVAITHSIVVFLLSVAALWVGEETFTKDASHWLQVGSGIIVILLGSWMLIRRIRQKRIAKNKLGEVKFQFVSSAARSPMVLNPGDHHHDHSTMSDDEHARAHAATIPAYAKNGERPTIWQILAFGAAGGMIPCPASVTVMLLALSVGKFGLGVLTVSGFSLGLAITLVGIGLAVVAGLNKIRGSGHVAWISANAPILSAAVVILSGFASLLFAH